MVKSCHRDCYYHQNKRRVCGAPIPRVSGWTNPYGNRIAVLTWICTTCDHFAACHT